MNRLPDAVLRENAAGHFERVATRRLRAGDRVRVLSGEAFPADGTIVRGRTHADEALLTGESTPVLRAEGDTDRKSTRLNSSHLVISYAVFCLKKKKAINHLVDSLSTASL